MSDEFVVITINASRPPEIPSHWIVCQAPRPLWGNREMESVWHCVAIDPQCADAREMLTHASDMRAQVVEFCTDARLKDFVATERANLNGFEIADEEVLAHVKSHLYLYNRAASIEDLLKTAKAAANP